MDNSIICEILEDRIKDFIYTHSFFKKITEMELVIQHFEEGNITVEQKKHFSTIKTYMTEFLREAGKVYFTEGFKLGVAVGVEAKTN